MQAKDWIVCLVEPNKFEAKIITDMLRDAGAKRVEWVSDSAGALEVLEMFPANIVILAVEATPIDGVAWTKALRRNKLVVNRKASVFLTSRAFSRALAEDCRHAGANALIGKPLSAKVLVATIKKVLTNPRPFIDATHYVGPCRRAGIVTAGAPKRRREADAGAPAHAGLTLDTAIASLSHAVAERIESGRDTKTCEIALRLVQGYAVNAGDGPLMRACAAFALLLGVKQGPPELMREAFEAAIAGVREMAAMDVAEAEARDAIAERVRQAVAKAATRRAA